MLHGACLSKEGRRGVRLMGFPCFKSHKGTTGTGSKEKTQWDFFFFWFFDCDVLYCVAT